MQQARASLQKLLLETLRGAPPAEAAVLAWQVLCGSAVASKTRALGLDSGTLRIEVPDAAWRAQLLQLRPQYETALGKIVPVGRIEFVLPKRLEGPIAWKNKLAVRRKLQPARIHIGCP